MNKHIFIAATALIMPVAADALTVNGDASVIILNALTATQDQAMNFGRILPTATADKVTLSPAGVAQSDTLGVYGPANAGRFTIRAQASTPLTITFGNGSVSNNSNSMVIDTFTSTSTPASNTTDADGNLTLNVGANLHVGANQAPGTYTGTYTVTVSY